MNILRNTSKGFHFYIIGIILLTLGIALTILSKLGASPFDALLVGLYRTFGLTIGSWEVVVGLTMILCNALAEKRPPEYIALLTSLITGFGIDTWLFLLRNFLEPTNILPQYSCLLLGIIFTGIGVATYLQSSIAPNPMDRSMQVISKFTGWSVTYSRALISLILVILAFFFSGAIGIGTIINALLSGVLISLFLPYLEKIRIKSLHKQTT
ncbi:YczE/YyaS/YitT family protein [Aquibacillus kalidii]|uniref:YczE/YyaS/YitT family protein n=1 Tax=Aquibacillus kalidii TaxID=2762597 RepID=UPI002E2AEBB9|nr:YitT family protein [Aquibacillus kalidii]